MPKKSQHTTQAPSPSVLTELFKYDPETGVLTWKPRKVSWFHSSNPERDAKRWNNLYAGKEAFTSLTANGYRQGSVLGYRSKAHRVIIAMATGAWPEQVDHINGDKTDNRLSNLRAVDAFENMKNMKALQKKSGLPPGVTLRRTRPNYPYEVAVRVDGKQKYIGRYKTPEIAAVAYRKALKEYGYSDRHGT